MLMKSLYLSWSVYLKLISAVFMVLLATSRAWRVFRVYNNIIIKRDYLQQSESANLKLGPYYQYGLRAYASPSSKTSNAGKSNCNICKGSGAQSCATCKGTGRDMAKGDIFQRMMCNGCKGFGMIPCSCSKLKGLTPEQTGER